MRQKLKRKRRKKWEPSRADFRLYHRVREYLGMPSHEMVVIGETICRIGWLGTRKHPRMVMVATSVKIDDKLTKEFLEGGVERLFGNTRSKK